MQNHDALEKLNDILDLTLANYKFPNLKYLYGQQFKGNRGILLLLRVEKISLASGNNINKYRI